MGVPGFFAWLRRKYPQIVDDSATTCESEGNACDNLYVGKGATTTAVLRMENWTSLYPLLVLHSLR